VTFDDPILLDAYAPIPPAAIARARARLASCDGTAEEIADVLAMVGGVG